MGLIGLPVGWPDDWPVPPSRSKIIKIHGIIIGSHTCSTLRVAGPAPPVRLVHIDLSRSSQLWHTTGNSSRIRQEVASCHPPSSKIGQEMLILMRRALSGVHKMLTFLRRYPRRSRLLLARPGLSWCRDYMCRLSQWLFVQCCYVFPASEQLHDNHKLQWRSAMIRYTYYNDSYSTIVISLSHHYSTSHTRHSHMHTHDSLSHTLAL